MPKSLKLNSNLLDNDYREVLRLTLLDKKKRFGKEYTFKNMAAACRVQTAYLSNVLLKKGHLNSDQVWQACQFLSLLPDEARLVSSLAEHQRSVFQERKAALAAEIEILASKVSATEKVFSSTKPDTVPEWFHLDMMAQLARQYLRLVSGSKTGPENIAQRIGISLNKTTELIQSLVNVGLVQLVNGTYHCADLNVHLSAQSKQFDYFFRQRLQFALDQSERINGKNDYRFSVLYTADEEFQFKLQEKLLEVVRWAESQVKNSPARDVYMLNMHSCRMTS